MHVRALKIADTSIGIGKAKRGRGRQMGEWVGERLTGAGDPQDRFFPFAFSPTTPTPLPAPFSWLVEAFHMKWEKV